LGLKTFSAHLFFFKKKKEKKLGEFLYSIILVILSTWPFGERKVVAEEGKRKVILTGRME